MYSIEIFDVQNRLLHLAAGEKSAHMLYEKPYQEGDRIIFCSDAQHCAIQADQTMPETLLYLPDRKFVYSIPFGELKSIYAPQGFSGDRHVITLRPALPRELTAHRNIALNPYDQRFYEGCYPHACANVETRDEPQFFARNAIDGMKCSFRHGHWPFQSWGIGGRADAAITLHFGRAVMINEIGLTLRADFPHDNWWTRGTLTFSDGSQTFLSFQKTGETQFFNLGEHRVEWIRLSELIMSDEPSPYPALTEWEAFGWDIL